jgi:hypothetical protein
MLYAMRAYKNISGDSGVIAYQTGKDRILVQFADGGIYEYTYASTGHNHVESMKVLAAKGRGLATFINQYVRDAYARKVA